jgi:drug/metabolite transporter (DMT)-like permease
VICIRHRDHFTALSSSFQGIVVAAISYYLQIWVIEKKGPVFLSMSMPLSLVFTMAIASFALGEDVSLGR